MTNTIDHLFRMYDIRGRVADELTPDVVERIGAAFGRMVLERAGPGRAGSTSLTVAVGRDMRLSSPELSRALVTGLTGLGIDVLDIGLCTTPLLYFTVNQPPAKVMVAGGVMITGSHNPPEYNGLKLCLGTATLYGDALQQIKMLVEKDGRQRGAATPVSTGRQSGVKTAKMIPAYLNHIAMDIGSEQRVGGGGGASGGRLRVVIDAGNGTAGLVAPELLRRIGCDVIELFCEPDGNFPNHHPDPTILENLADLKRTVLAEKADFGVAYDGDADRIGVIDDQGAVIWGDQLLVLFARALLRQRPGALVIADVKSSLIVKEAVADAGGRLLMWKTGHSLIKAKMKESGALLAGEMSGHIFFADRYFGFDDAVYATARLTELVRRAKSGGRRLSDLTADRTPTSSTPEIRIDCRDDQKFSLVERISRQTVGLASSSPLLSGIVPPLKVREVVTVDGIRIEFDEGWGLVRASNTQPAIVVRCEARTPAGLAAVEEVIRRVIRSAAEELGLTVNVQW